jgi:hypothetical protein
MVDVRAVLSLFIGRFFVFVGEGENKIGRLGALGQLARSFDREVDCGSANVLSRQHSSLRRVLLLTLATTIPEPSFSKWTITSAESFEAAQEISLP